MKCSLTGGVGKTAGVLFSLVENVRDDESMREPEDALRQAIERDPGNASAFFNLGMYLAQEPTRLAEAEAAYQKAISLEPDNPQYTYRLGLLLYENLGRPEEAETAYRRSIELAPDDPFFYGGLISLLVQGSR